MREILFRAKRLDSSEWVEGHLISYEDGRARIVASKTDIFCYEKDDSVIQTVSHLVDLETICQYTGMKDIENNKIFEGDIMETSIDGLKYHVGVVEFSDASFGLKCTNWDAFFLCFVAGNYKIIGNIHDNPEFLTV